MTVKVYIPTRIRVDVRVLEERQTDIEEALAAASVRALANSRDIVLARRGGYSGIKVHTPEITWSGSGLAGVSQALRTTIEQCIAEALTQAVKSTKLFDFAKEGEKIISPLAEKAVEKLDQSRYNLQFDAYAIPGYQKKGTPVPVPVQQPPSRQALSDSEIVEIARRLRGSNGTDRSITFLQNVADRLRDGDRIAFGLALLAIQPDDSQPTSVVFEAMREFARRHPHKFQEYLLYYATLQSKKIIEKLKRTEMNIEAPRSTFLDLDIATGVVRVAEEIPDARRLLSHWEKQAHGLQRLINLTNAVMEIRHTLEEYLEKSQEKTDSSTLYPIINITYGLSRLLGLFAAEAGEERFRAMIYDLEVDLIEHYRWIVATLEKVRTIDSKLSIYRLIYGNAADQQDEIQVLREVRNQYLQNIAENIFPTASGISKLLTNAGAFYNDWQGIAADRKREKLKNTFGELKKSLMQLPYAIQFDTWSDDDRLFNKRLDETRASLAAIEKELENAGKQGRGEDYLNEVNDHLQKLPFTVARISLLSFWSATLQVEKATWYPQEIGSRAERRRWYDQLSKVRREMITAYQTPNYSTLNSQYQTWKDQIENIQHEMKRAINREIAITLVITVVAIVVTAGVGSAVAGAEGSMLLVTLAEAATFTAITSIGQLAMGKTVTVETVASSFVENATLFAAFRILNLGIVAVAKTLAPGRALVQLSIIFGTNALAATSVPLVIKRMETGHWPENTGTFVISSLLLNAIAALISGPSLLKELRLQGQQDTLNRLIKLEQQYKEWLVSMDTIIDRGGPTQAEFEAAQVRGSRFYNELEQILNRMASNEFTEEALTKLGLTRTQVQELSALAKEYATGLANAQYAPPPTQRALQPPNEVVGMELVLSGSNTFEYNPSAPGSRLSTLKTRLTKAGYVVTDEGGGVLQLTGKEPETKYLLLPARTDVKPPALTSLVRGAERLVPKGISILQQQNAVPSLEATLVSLAKSKPEITRLILAGIGRYIEPTNVRALQGIAHFLEIGGDPEVLGVTLGNGRRYGRSYVLKALEVFNDLTPEDARGVGVIVAVRGSGGGATDSIIGIGHNFSPARSVYGALHDIAPFTDGGLDEVIRYLASESQNLNQAGLGSLLAAKRLVQANPGSRIVFEVEITQEGRLIRVTDVRLNLPKDNPLGFLRAEVKEVTNIKVLEVGKSINQFARDVVIETQNPPPSTYRTLARLKWFIRRPVHNDAAHTPFTDAELLTRRNEIKDILRRAFDERILRTHPQRDKLLQEFEQYFDEIVQFF